MSIWQNIIIDYKRQWYFAETDNPQTAQSKLVMQNAQGNLAMKITLSMQDAQGKQSEQGKQFTIDKNENLEARAKLAVEKDIMETSRSTGFPYKISKKNKNRLIKNKIKDLLMQQDKDLFQQDPDFRLQQLQQEKNISLQQEKQQKQENDLSMQQEKQENEFRMQHEKQENEFRMEIILLEQTLIVPQLNALRDLKLALPTLGFGQCVSRIHHLMAYDHYFRSWVETNYANKFLEETNNMNELWRIAMTWFCLNVDQARLNDEVLKTLQTLLNTQINIKNSMRFAESDSDSDSDSYSDSDSEIFSQNRRSSMYLDTQIKIKKSVYISAEPEHEYESESKSEIILENRQSIRYLKTELIPFVKSQFRRFKTPPMKGDIATANVLFFPFRSTGFDFESVIILINKFLGGERKISRIPMKSNRIPSDISMVLR